MTYLWYLCGVWGSVLGIIITDIITTKTSNGWHTRLWTYNEDSEYMKYKAWTESQMIYVRSKHVSDQHWEMCCIDTNMCRASVTGSGWKSAVVRDNLLACGYDDHIHHQTTSWLALLLQDMTSVGSISICAMAVSTLVDFIVILRCKKKIF